MLLSNYAVAPNPRLAFNPYFSSIFPQRTGHSAHSKSIECARLTLPTCPVQVNQQQPLGVQNGKVVGHKRRALTDINPNTTSSRQLRPKTVRPLFPTAFQLQHTPSIVFITRETQHLLSSCLPHLLNRT